MRAQRISLEDIAVLAGVTKMTVSRYLRMPHLVAKQTGERIASVIKEINYQMEFGELPGQSYTVGVLIPSFQNLLFSDLLSGIESVTSQKNIQVLIANYNYFQDSEEKQIIRLLQCHINGIILCEKQHSIRAIKYLQAAHIPIVEVMDIIGDKLDMQVGFNNKKAAFDMINIMLAKRSHCNIVYMGSKDDLRDKQRFFGYCEAMQQAGLETFRINPQSISSVELGWQLMCDALYKQPVIDGVLCSNDDLAMGALLCCQQKHISVPEQIAIAGFHGLDMGQYSCCRLASVITPRFAIGRTAAQILLDRIGNIEIAKDKIKKLSVDLGYQLYYGDTL